MNHLIEQFQQDQHVRIAAHRGYSAKYPENTLLAFEKALAYDIDMLEFDLRLTKDEEVVIIHDKTVDRTTNGTGNVHDYSLKDLKALNAGEGETIPTLSELCELVFSHPNILLNVEIKPQAKALTVADQAIETLKEFQLMNQCVFTSFDAEVIHYLSDTYHVKTQGFPKDSMFNYVDGEEGTLSKLWAVAIHMDHLTPEIVQKNKKAGKLVWCYCPDDDTEVRYSLNCGVSLVTCNELLPALNIIKKK